MYKKGFTLIELIVVIAIIGILAGIIVSGLTGAKAAGRDARRVSDLKNIQLSLALYYNDNNHYPCSLTTTGFGNSSNCYPDFTPAYMATVPKDPSGSTYVNNGNYIYTALQFEYPTDGLTCANKTVASYHLGGVMEALHNSILAQDADAAITGYSCNQAAASFDGNASNCANGGSILTAATAGDENCYDVAPGS